MKKLNIKHLTPLILIAILIGVSLYFRWFDYLSISSLHAHHEQLIAWREQHYLLLVLGFIGIYILGMLCAIPGALFTLFGGFLFGAVLGTLFTLIGAVLGSTILFTAVRYAAKDWAQARVSTWFNKLKTGLEANAFSYLMAIRLVPVVPFFVVNIAAGLLNIRIPLFMLATLIGIIPETLIYSILGSDINHLFNIGVMPNLQIVLSPSVLLPLLGLALLALLPAICSYYQKRRQKKLNHHHRPHCQEDKPC